MGEREKGTDLILSVFSVKWDHQSKGGKETDQNIRVFSVKSDQ
jgi:hypothetical protein